MTAVCCELASNRLLKIKRQDKETMREASPALGVVGVVEAKVLMTNQGLKEGFHLGINTAFFNFD